MKLFYAKQINSLGGANCCIIDGLVQTFGPAVRASRFPSLKAPSAMISTFFCCPLVLPNHFHLSRKISPIFLRPLKRFDGIFTRVTKSTIKDDFAVFTDTHWAHPARRRCLARLESWDRPVNGPLIAWERRKSRTNCESNINWVHAGTALLVKLSLVHVMSHKWSPRDRPRNQNPNTPRTHFAAL